MNKKLLSSMAAGLLSASFLSADGGSATVPLSLCTGIGFDSEYVERGFKWGQQVFTPGIEIGASVFDGGEIYFSNENFLGVKDSWFNKNNLTVGFFYEAAELFAVDLGFTAHIQRNLRKEFNAKALDLARKVAGNPNLTLANIGIDPAKLVGVKKRSYEIYAGLTADVLLNPSLYFAYDFTWKRYNLEAMVKHLHDLSSVGLNGFAVVLSAKLGYDRTKRPLGIKKDVVDIAEYILDLKKSYLYYGAQAGIRYTFNPNAYASIDMKYEGLNKKKAWAFRGHKNLIWVSTAITCSF
jgi:hypothetical protein